MERGGGSVFEAPMLFIARVPKRGALPRLRCLVKPPPMHLNRRLSYPLRAHPRPIRNPTQNCTNQAQPRHRKPRRPVANYSTAGVSRTLPCGRILNSSICSGNLGNPYGAPSRYLLCFTSAEESPGTCSFHKLLPMEHLLHQTPCSSGTYRLLYLPTAFPT